MQQRKRVRLRNIGILLAIIGPGLITSLVDNDAGGITTYSVAGASFGYSMLWTLIPITFLLILVQEMCARMGAITGKGLSDLIRENFGVTITMFIMVGLVIANLAVTMAEFVGMAAVGEMFGLSKYMVVGSMALLVLFLIIRFNYRSLEKIFLGLSVFYIAYILSAILAKPDWGFVMKQTLTPTITISAGYLVLLIGVVGTTITPWMQFYLQSAVVEKGITRKDYKYSKWDTIIGCIVTDVIAFFIIVVCAATLFTNGIAIEGAVDAAAALRPLAGNYASLLFGIGFFGAAFLGAFIVPLATSFFVCEAFGWESGVNKRLHEAKQFYGLLFMMLAVSAGIILIPNLQLVKFMIMSQVINGVLLPVILIAILLLINKKELMGNYTNSTWYNIFAWGGSILIIIITVVMIYMSFLHGVAF